MHIVLVSLSVAAIALLLLVIPLLALQALLHLVGPARRPLTAREGEMDDAVEELPSRVLELFRVAR